MLYTNHASRPIYPLLEFMSGSPKSPYPVKLPDPSRAPNGTDNKPKARIGLVMDETDAAITSDKDSSGRIQ